MHAHQYSTGTGPIPVASLELLSSAVAEMEAAVSDPRPAGRYLRGHLVARRTAAAVLAARARPVRSRPGDGTGTSTSTGPGAADRPRDVWGVLATVAPELREWAAFFAAGTGKRIAVETGLAAVTAREADDLARDAHNFLDVVAVLLSRGRGVAR